MRILACCKLVLYIGMSNLLLRLTCTTSYGGTAQSCEDIIDSKGRVPGTQELGRVWVPRRTKCASLFGKKTSRSKKLNLKSYEKHYHIEIQSVLRRQLRRQLGGPTARAICALVRHPKVRLFGGFDFDFSLRPKRAATQVL